MRTKRKVTYYCLVVLLTFILLSLATIGIGIASTEKISLQNYHNGRDGERYIALAFSDTNFKTNSYLNYAIVRHYLKGKTAATITSAYEQLAATHPQWQFIYAELGWKNGGRFRPHRTHRNGMSADFVTPVYRLDAQNTKTSATLPSHILNLWTYNIRLDDHGNYKNYQMNAEALIAHVAALEEAGKHYNVSIKQVILEPSLLQILQTYPEFKRIQHIPFMQGKAWFPHDGHYHIDFQ